MDAEIDTGTLAKNAAKASCSPMPPRKLTARNQKIESTLFAVILFPSFLAQWLFWAGFVRTGISIYPFFVDVATILLMAIFR
jgi:steroid 5-alpha reductase family enzyme